METAEKPVPHDLLPEFPRLTGPLGMLVDSITDDIPYEHKALTALTYVGLALSGRTKLAGGDYDTLQPRFYSCLIGPPGTGKSAAMKEVKRALKGSEHPIKDDSCSGWSRVHNLGDVHVLESMNSGPALVKSLSRHSRLLLLPDEASGIFEKAKSGRMFSDLLRLLEDNETAHVVRDKETTVRDAHFAMVLSATPPVFADMWTGTGGASSGLQSRFVLAFSEKKMPRVPTGNDSFGVDAAVADLRYLLKNLPEFIDLPERKGDFTHGLTEGLDDAAVDAARVIDMGRRFALVMAICNGKTRIEAGDESIQLGRAFIRYQLSVSERFMPADSWGGPVQRFENRILGYFKRHPGTHTERDVRNNLKPENSPGGFEAFRRAFDNLTANETEAVSPGKSAKYQKQSPSTSGELVKAGTKGAMGRGSTLWKLNPDRDPLPTLPTLD